MSRPSRYTELVALRLTPEQAAWLDAKAPRLSRSEALRLLLDQAMDGQHPVVVADTPVVATPAPTLAQVAPGPIRTSASRITEVDKEEWIKVHDKYNPTQCKGGKMWRLDDATVTRHRGRLVASCECGCGERRYV